MSAPNSITAEPRRFSIRLPRALWIGVAAIVLFAVAFGSHAGVPIYRQEMALREIERLGGFVENYPLPRKPLPIWIRSYRCLCDVCVVKLDGNADDGTLACLGELPAGRFEVLSLCDTQVSDAGLAHLKRLTHLRSLTLKNTRVNDAGLAELNGLARLKDLDLSATGVTDAGIAHLKGLVRLECLELGDTAVTGAGMAHLEGLRNLESLRLKNTRVTDSGLAEFRGLASLEDLDLSGTLITDEGMANLKGLQNLKCLWIANTQVTVKGVAELLGALPGLSIYLGNAPSRMGHNVIPIDTEQIVPMP